MNVLHNGHTFGPLVSGAITIDHLIKNLELDPNIQWKLKNLQKNECIIDRTTPLGNSGTFELIKENQQTDTINPSNVSNNAQSICIPIYQPNSFRQTFHTLSHDNASFHYIPPLYTFNSLSARSSLKSKHKTTIQHKTTLAHTFRRILQLYGNVPTRTFHQEPSTFIEIPLYQTHNSSPIQTHADFYATIALEFLTIANQQNATDNVQLLAILEMCRKEWQNLFPTQILSEIIDRIKSNFALN